MLAQYLNKIARVARQADAREESFYRYLAELLEELGNSNNRKNTQVTVSPKKTEAGIPDFRIWCGNMKIVGYIEAKGLGKNLDEVEKTEQICRYTTTFTNFLLTNFIEFRLYKTGNCISKVRISELKSIFGVKEIIPIESEKKGFEALMEKFFSFSHPSITSTNFLAIELAKRTRFLRDEVISQQIEEENRSGITKILDSMMHFKNISSED